MKRTRTQQRRAQKPKLSIIIPVYNEQQFVGEVIQRVAGSYVPGTHTQKQIIVVDDGSTDGTVDVLRPLEKRKAIELIVHEKNRGKGTALRNGLGRVTGDIIIIQDADLEYDPAEYERLVSPMLTGHADVVYGSRFVQSEPHRVLYFWHSIGNKLLTFLSNMFTDLNLTDMETGFKAFRASILKDIRIEEDRFGFEPEITAKVARRARREGVRMYEVGISYHGRTYAEGKKIGWKDGVKALYCILKYNLFRG